MTNPLDMFESAAGNRSSGGNRGALPIWLPVFYLMIPVLLADLGLFLFGTFFFPAWSCILFGTFHAMACWLAIGRRTRIRCALDGMVLLLFLSAHIQMLESLVVGGPMDRPGLPEAIVIFVFLSIGLWGFGWGFLLPGNELAKSWFVKQKQENEQMRIADLLVVTTAIGLVGGVFKLYGWFSGPVRGSGLQSEQLVGMFFFSFFALHLTGAILTFISGRPLLKLSLHVFRYFDSRKFCMMGAGLITLMILSVYSAGFVVTGSPFRLLELNGLLVLPVLYSGTLFCVFLGLAKFGGPVSSPTSFSSCRTSMRDMP